MSDRFRGGTLLFGRVMLAAAVSVVTLAFTGATALAQDESWRQEWARTVEAANREGHVDVAGPSGRGWRDFLTQRFQRDYPGITLKLTAFAGRDFWPRLIKEREVGQYLWDLRVGGSDDNTHVLKAQGVFDPIRERLLLPEVVDGDNWHGGLDGLFVDRGARTLVAFALYEQTTAHYNKRIIPAGLAVKDLVRPEWTGRISMADPRGGSPLNTVALLFKIYGDDFVRTFMIDQKPAITKDPRQQVEWLASGRYPVAFGLPTAALVEYGARGANIEDFAKMEGALSWTQGVGGVSLINKAPHPNAATVFINWILTRDVQAELMQAVKLNSRRKDVPQGDPGSAIDTSRLSEYVGSQHEEMEQYHKKASALVRELVR
jgi:iron(III) transport system substrate-binding protein